MIKQTLFFSTPVSLSLKNYQMVISWKDRADKVTRPIEDMGCVVLENQQISVTLPLLNELVKNNVAVVLCDNKQMPTAMLQCWTEIRHKRKASNINWPSEKQQRNRLGSKSPRLKSRIRQLYFGTTENGVSY